MKHQPNDPALAGRLASSVVVFGRAGRYQLAAVHTRFEAVQFFVWDTSELDEDGLPRVCRQEATEESARRGLEDDRLFLVRAEELPALGYALGLAASSLSPAHQEDLAHLANLGARHEEVNHPRPEAPLGRFWVVFAPVTREAELADVLWSGDLATLRLAVLGGGLPLALYPEWGIDAARAHAQAILGR
jgi:hypothetical protein